MSTRSIILATSSKGTARIYKHQDGYPTGNLPLIRDTLKRMAKLQDKIDKENEKYASDYMFRSEMREPASTFSGLLIGESTNEYGMGAQLEEHFYGAFNPKEHLGNQWDLEWIYVVDLDAKTVKIYSGNFKEGPLAGYEDGVADPESYAQCLREEYQASSIAETKAEVAALEAIGYKVNPKSNVLKLPVKKKAAAKKAPAKVAKKKAGKK